MSEIQLNLDTGKDEKVKEWYPVDCQVCGDPLQIWESTIELAILTGEFSGNPDIHRLVKYDKHIRCSPSRAQRIVNEHFPAVVDKRPQFDWRRDDNGWTDKMREKYKELYTTAWIKLQLDHNPDWASGGSIK